MYFHDEYLKEGRERKWLNSIILARRRKRRQKKLLAMGI